MLPLFPFVAGLLAGGAAVGLWRRAGTPAGVHQAPDGGSAATNVSVPTQTSRAPAAGIDEVAAARQTVAKQAAPKKTVDRKAAAKVRRPEAGVAP